MKIHLSVTILIFNFLCCYSEEKVKKEYHEDKLYVGNPDDDADIERPCPVYDLRCIRRFFAEHSKCVKSNGPIPDPVEVSQLTLYLSRTNTTATLTNIRTTGLNTTRIEEFYINRRTNKVVFAINLQYSQESPSVYFRFYRRSREPVVAVANTTVFYRSVTFTAIIPNIDDIQLEKAEITAYVVDVNNPFMIGPEVANNPDPQVAASVSEMLADAPTAFQELMLTEAFIYLPIYVQYNICDFGLKIS